MIFTVAIDTRVVLQTVNLTSLIWNHGGSETHCVSESAITAKNISKILNLNSEFWENCTPGSSSDSISGAAKIIFLQMGCEPRYSSFKYPATRTRKYGYIIACNGHSDHIISSATPLVRMCGIFSPFSYLLSTSLHHKFLQIRNFTANPLSEFFRQITGPTTHKYGHLAHWGIP